VWMSNVSRSCDHDDHRPFPTRRSSDLVLRPAIVTGPGSGPPAEPAAPPGRLAQVKGEAFVALRDEDNAQGRDPFGTLEDSTLPRDRKSTRLNSSHVKISYAVFCLKKKR